MICHCPRHSHWFLTCTETIRLLGTYFTSMNFLKTCTTLGNKLLSFDKHSILKKFSKKKWSKRTQLQYFILSSQLVARHRQHLLYKGVGGYWNPNQTLGLALYCDIYYKYDLLSDFEC